MRLKNVIVVNDNAFVQGGAAKVAIGSARLLADAGYAVTFFAASGPPESSLVGHPNIKTVCLHENYDINKLSTKTRLIRGIWDVEAKKKFDAVLSAANPADTVIHVHMVREQLSSSVFPPMFDRQFSVVMTPHEYNIGCPYGGFFHYAKGTICPQVGMSLGCMLDHCNRGPYVRKLWFFTKGKVQQVIAGIPRRLKDYIFISDFSQRRLEPYLPADANKHFVRNPIEMEDSGVRVLQKDSPFLFVGRMTIEKDPVLFAEAAKRMGVRAVFIGDGELRPAVEEVNPDAECLGWIERDEVKKWMLRSRALVFPSIWYEGQPLTVQEAEALGLPSIVSDACAPSEYVQNGSTGLVFRASDVNDLCEKMGELLDDSRAEEMAQAAHARFWSDPPTPAKHLQGLLQVYETMLERRAAN